MKHLAIGKFKTLVGIKVIRFTLKKLPEGQYIYYLESFCVSCPIWDCVCSLRRQNTRHFVVMRQKVNRLYGDKPVLRNLYFVGTTQHPVPHINVIFVILETSERYWIDWKQIKNVLFSGQFELLWLWWCLKHTGHVFWVLLTAYLATRFLISQL